MAEAPFMPFATDAFVADTTALDDAETGAYMMLLVDLWRSDTGTLPLDHKKLARTARCQQAAWPDRWDAIKGYFDITDGVISQARVLRDRAKVRAKIEKARDNGKKGGRPKLQETNENKPAGYDPVNQNLTQKKANQNHNQLREESIGSNEPLHPTHTAANFEGEAKPAWLVLGDWILDAAGLANEPRPITTTIVRDWIAAGWTVDQIKAGVTTATGRATYKPPRSLKFFEDAIREAAAKPAADSLAYCRSYVADFNEPRWRGALYRYARGEAWPEPIYGPAPNKPGTLVWPFLLEVYRDKYGSLEPNMALETEGAA